MKYLVVCETIVIGYISILVSSDYIINDSSNTQLVNKIAVESGNRKFFISSEDITFFHSSAGVVSIYLKNQQKYITQFKSLEELKELLPDSSFFHVSRQYIVSKDTIKAVEKDKNRKLIVFLDPEYATDPHTDITVSRYRSQDFKKWLG